MKLSKVLIVCTLLAGGMAPLAAVSSLKNEVKIAQADTTKDLSTIISAGNVSFTPSYIDNFFFDFNLSEQIFNRTGYMNDHIDEFLDENSQPINLGDGIIVNGQTLNYWINFEPDPVSYPRNDGVVAFPLHAGKVFNPVAVEVATNKLAFKVNLEYFPMDDIEVTFKAGFFKGYYNGTVYSLSEDLTFYSTLVDSFNRDISRVTFVRERQETIINGKIASISDWGQKTNSQGGTYHKYVLFTNIPRDKSQIADTYPATHWRNVYDNYLLNGKTFTEYNAWVRGTSKDFTNLGDASTITREYETGKPGGVISVNECLALYIENPTDQDNYVAIINVPDQLLVDFSLESVSFSLRDGSVWYSLDENGNPIKGRVDQVAFNNLVYEASQTLENYVDISTFSEKDQLAISEIISSAQSEMWNTFSQIGIDNIVAEAKAAIDEIAGAEQRHIDAVVALIDAIPDVITYSEECRSAINVAMEAFATLTASEVNKFPADKLEKLYNAYSAFAELDLNNFKVLSKAEIRAKVNLIDYRPLQQSAINDLLTNTDALIDEAGNKAEVQEAVDAFVATLATIPTDKQLSALELQEAKDEAIAQLEAIDLDQYRPAERAQVEELIRNGIVAINQCKTIEEVNQLLEKIMTVINAIKTDAELTQAATITKQTQQRNTIIIVIVISLTLIIGMGLAIFFIRRRKHQ